MSLKSALFEMKDALLKQQLGQSEEEFIHKLEAKNKLSVGTLIFYFNNLMMLTMNNSKYDNRPQNESKKVNRKWTKNEILFMFQYIKERQEEGGLNITEILEEMAQLLNRGYQSVNYKYYSMIKTKDKQQTSKQNGYHFTTISQSEVPVISTEAIIEEPPAPKRNPINPSQDGDLLDILSGLITNVQQLPDINLNELLRSLYKLTTMALQNQGAVQHIETIKSEVNLEKEALRKKLLQEKKRNDELQKEVSMLAKEINAFNQLGDAAKIQHLKSYSQRLNYIIDGSGVVLQVGS